MDGFFSIRIGLSLSSEMSSCRWVGLFLGIANLPIEVNIWSDLFNPEVNFDTVRDLARMAEVSHLSLNQNLFIIINKKKKWILDETTSVS